MKQVFLSFLALAFVALIAVTFLTYSTYAGFVTDEKTMLSYKKSGIVLTDRNDEVFYRTGSAGESEFIPLSKISDNLEKSVIAAEDKDFYSHGGISFIGIGRSIYFNVKNSALTHGGSTITQQLVKNTLLSQERNFMRKYQEMLLTFLVEDKFTKDEILAMYLNSVYFGDGAIGIEEAAQTFFAKSAAELTLSESAYLASILKSPNLYTPGTGNTENGIALQKQLLERMKEERIISQEEYSTAASSDLAFSRKVDEKKENTAIHFALSVIQQLEKMYGDDVLYGGFTVKTSLHLPWQKYAQEQVRLGVAGQTSQGVGNGAAVVMDAETGEVLAYVGSHNWFDAENGRVNMAQSPRSPGSSFKPIVYALALENNTITPATVLRDRPTTFQGDYKPKNYDSTFRGNVPVRRALANSLNVPSVEVMNRVGVSQVLSKAPEFGIHSLGSDTSQYGLSLVLGSGEVPLVEMVNAYTVFANHGERPEPTYILEVRNKFDDVIYSHESKQEEVLSPETAFLISSILSDSRARREVFGTALDTKFPVAVKTGTSEDYRDAWTIGYSPGLVIGVWVGNNDNSSMNRVAGSLGAAPIWRNLVNTFMSEKKPEPFSPPEGVVKTAVCIVTRSGSKEQASTSARTYTEFFKEGTVPNGRRCILEREKIASVHPSTTPTPGEEQPAEEVKPPENHPEELPNLNIGGIQIQIIDSKPDHAEENNQNKDKENEESN